MSSTSGAIKGGMAYVQAYLDDNPITQGLAKLQGKIKSWQAGLSRMAAGTMGGELPEPFAAIARFAASPAGAFSALLGAAKFTADAREEMLRMSETTGVSVEKLSQYAYAARRAGLSTEALANGLKRMQSKEFMAAMQGMGGKGGGLKGVTNAAIAGLGTGDAAEQLRNFIKLTENMPTAEKIGLAKRLGISELLPLINQGVDSLDAFTARARQLGLVMSEEDAKAGKKFTQAFGDLSDVLKSSVGAIGGALVPMITGLTNLIVPVVAGIRDWIKNHKYLTVALFAGTGAIVAGGIALQGLAVVTGIASKALNVLQYAVKGVQFAFQLLSMAIGWLPLLANPWVLAGLAIAGVVVWIAKLAGSFDGLSALWNGLATDFADSFGAISNALSKGDIEAAWNVVTAFLKTEWIRVTNFLAQAWANFSDYVMQWMDHYAPWFAIVVRTMVASWDWFVEAWHSSSSWISKTWSGICDWLGGAFKGAIEFCSELWNKFLDWVASTTSGGANANLRKIREEDARMLAAKQKGELEDRKRHRALEQEQRLQAAHVELKAAIDAANVPGPADKSRPGGQGELTPAMQAAVAGTFSGAVAGMLGGGGGVQEQILNVQQQNLELSEKWRAEANGQSEQQVQAVKNLGAFLSARWGGVW